MALTRKLLRGMGLTDEQVDTIIEAHTRKKRPKLSAPEERLLIIPKTIVNVQSVKSIIF